jgi:UDP-2,3-diacylglucosamine pyrophosphatase LpxH
MTLKPITLAVLSDIHVGAGARAQDLCPDQNKNAIDKNYRDLFLQFIRDKEIKPDYLLIPGDVSHSAQPAELEMASRFITDLCQELHIAEDRVLFVPGNHDVDWSVLNAKDPTGFRRAQRYAPLQNKEWIFDRVLRKAASDLLSPAYFCIWDAPDLLTVGYNSSWHDDTKSPIHHGLVAQEHITALERALMTLDLSPRRVRVFMAHHHPVSYSDPVPNEPEFSGMTNAQNLLSMLRRHQFDVLIHGHRHSPNFQTHIVDSGFPLAILSAGSFSATLDPRWSGYVNNQFHLFRISGRDKDHQAVHGVVESWAYLCSQGWIPSQKHNGIRHQVPFGTYLQFHQLRPRLRNILATHFARRQYTTWAEIVASDPPLEHVPADLAIEVLSSLTSELSFDTHEGVDGLVLLLRADYVSS